MDSDFFFFFIAFVMGFTGFYYVHPGWEANFIYILNPEEVAVFLNLAIICLFTFIISCLFSFHKLKRPLLYCLITILVILPTLLSIYHRHSSDNPATYVHDNPLQIETAMDFLLHGQNPYTQDYFHTQIGRWAYSPPLYDFKASRPPLRFSVNPALYNIVSLPFGFIAPMPIHILTIATLGWTDVRLFYLICYLATIFIASHMVSPQKRFAFMCLFALNPFLSPYIIEGRNDILTLLLIVLLIYALKHTRLVFAGVIAGLALGTKQSTWPIVGLIPFYLHFVQTKSSQTFKFLSVTIFIFSLLILPFLIQSPKEFISSTILYVSGNSATSYPIRGFGLSMTLMAFNLIPNALSAFPSVLLQIIFFIPGFILTIIALKRSATLSRFLLCSSLLLLIFLYFNRFFVTNYLGLLWSLIFLVYYLEHSVNN